ncbi:MAG: NYN domain-containing protein [Chloroflexi bacterium]|nr:NYN domain-containing protein [Chloroflexota bacterium]
MLLIDGHNLIGKLSNISLGEKDDEAKLVRMLENYRAMNPHERIAVVFDPARDGNGGWHDMHAHDGNIIVRFAKRGEAADDMIARIVKDARSPRSFTVISSDNAVQRAVRRHGAKTMLSEEFAEWLAAGGKPRVQKPVAPPPPPEKPEQPAAGDVTYWLRFFKEPPPHPPAPPKPPTGKARPATTAGATAKGGKSAGDDDIDEWLKLFNAPRDDAEPPKRVQPAESPARPTVRPKQDEEVDSIDYWLRVMNRKRDDSDS